MKKFEVTAIIPAARYETFVVEANNEDEAYRKVSSRSVGIDLVSSKTTTSPEDTEYSYPKEI
jgi:hypothetical protein